MLREGRDGLEAGELTGCNVRLCLACSPRHKHNEVIDKELEFVEHQPCIVLQVLVVHDETQYAQACPMVITELGLTLCIPVTFGQTLEFVGRKLWFNVISRSCPFNLIFPELHCTQKLNRQ